MFDFILFFTRWFKKNAKIMLEVCPICLVNNNDQTVGEEMPGQCFECGKLFCGSCSLQIKGGCKACPMCRVGFDVSISKKKTQLEQLLRRSVGQHTSWAQLNLAIMLEKQGLFLRATTLVEAAARSGNVCAMSTFGRHHFFGIGPLPQDMAVAFSWYMKAAKEGCALGQCGVAICFHRGFGIARDVQEAARYWKLGADQGQSESIRFLKMCLAEMFPVGTRVKLVGLVKSDMNGRAGRVVEAKGTLGRVPIRLAGGKKCVLVKFNNIVPTK